MINFNTVVETMNRVPWGDLRGVLNEPCDDIPIELTALLAQNPQTRREAYWRIDNRLIVQRGLYQGAAFAAPFIVQLIRVCPHEIRQEIYELLFQLANGTSAITNTILINRVVEPFPYIIPTLNGYNISLQVSCRFEIACTLDCFLSDLADTSSSSRWQALDIIGCFPEFLGMMPLSNIAQSDTDTENRNRIYLTIDRMKHPK
ncbi:MAG: hypothetical protein CMJ78_21265 [Planctomycetaceae bacterium]|nr:hypothetical protein [Planctomycetaceae bacterium]